MTEPTTFSSLTAMEKQGYIERRKLPHNAKNVNVYLTPRGRELRDVLVPIAEDINAAAVEGVSILGHRDDAAGSPCHHRESRARGSGGRRGESIKKPALVALARKTSCENSAYWRRVKNTAHAPELIDPAGMPSFVSVPTLRSKYLAIVANGANGVQRPGIVEPHLFAELALGQSGVARQASWMPWPLRCFSRSRRVPRR